LKTAFRKSNPRVAKPITDAVSTRLFRWLLPRNANYTKFNVR